MGVDPLPCRECNQLHSGVASRAPGAAARSPPSRSFSGRIETAATGNDLLASIAPLAGLLISQPLTGTVRAMFAFPSA
jgi:hypothetical protein